MLRSLNKMIVAHSAIAQTWLVAAAEGRCAAAAARAVRGHWRAVVNAIRDGHIHMANHILRQIASGVRMAIASELERFYLTSRRDASRTLARLLPPKISQRLLLRRMPARLPIREGIEMIEPGGDTDTLTDILFPPPTQSDVIAVVYSSGWQSRLNSSLAPASSIASAVAGGMVLGRSLDDLTEDLLPIMQGVESAARRIARTEGMRVAQAGQMDTHAELGDLVAGYQINATMDDRTRPEHRARDGTIYWANPRPGQLGYDSMPNPPQEANGEMAWNCRCYLTPVLREPRNEYANTPPFSEHAQPVRADPLVWADWFNHHASEHRKRLAVGARRYSTMQAVTGESAPGWEYFHDGTGAMLSIEQIEGEHEEARDARMQANRDAVDRQRSQKQRNEQFGGIGNFD